MVETISGTRELLTSHVARFRESGAQAAPVVFGDHRKPEAVLLSFETFQVLLDIVEDALIHERLRERESNDDGIRYTLDEVASELNINLDNL